MNPDAVNFSDGPLTGVRVLDLTSVIMGPFATKILGDLGADVIKIEGPEGDSTRHHQPARHPGMSGVFMNVNRNKRSVGLDLKDAAGADMLRRLIGIADIFIHSMRPDAISRLGFGYADVAAIKPDIVYCGAFGFGSTGPYRHKAAYDDVIQAGSGLAALSQRAGAAPAYVPTVMCDKVAGQAIAYSVLAAMIRRLRGGPGANIEVPMFETAIEFNLVEHMCGALFDPPLGPMGYPRVTSPSRRPFQTADGYICILPYSTQNWIDFFDWIDRPEVMHDPRFAQLSDRVRHIDELYTLVAIGARTRKTAEWVAFCDRTSIPCMPVVAINDLPADIHVKAVGLFQDYDHPTEGRYRGVRPGVSMDGADFVLRRHPPTLGQDTQEVLAELGVSLEELANLRNAGAII